jgi:hypothetical protein
MVEAFSHLAEILNFGFFGLRYSLGGAAEQKTFRPRKRW